MASTLRRRVPWSSSTASESTPLLESGEAIELAEVGGFASVAEADAALLSTPAAPIAVAVAVLGGLGFGAYEIYEHYKEKRPKLKLNKVLREYNKAEQNNFKYSDESIKENKENFVPLEHQHKQVDIVPLEDQHTDLTVPPYKYLGPGNPLDKGEPYNEIDADAKQHDTEYSIAETEDQVYESDQNFLKKASDHLVEGINNKESPSNIVGAALGLVGIGAKHGIEKTVGVQYPRNMG